MHNFVLHSICPSASALSMPAVLPDFDQVHACKLCAEHLRPFCSNHVSSNNSSNTSWRRGLSRTLPNDEASSRHRGCQ